MDRAPQSRGSKRGNQILHARAAVLGWRSAEPALEVGVHQGPGSGRALPAADSGGVLQPQVRHDGLPEGGPAVREHGGLQGARHDRSRGRHAARDRWGLQPHGLQEPGVQGGPGGQGIQQARLVLPRGGVQVGLQGLGRCGESARAPLGEPQTPAVPVEGQELGRGALARRRGGRLAAGRRLRDRLRPAELHHPLRARAQARQPGRG
mmetsp:Transcript_19718/g.40127  ORF Transcript_19718/g.40127 Transcript_19718/m.40127 type:complete len:207 (+) Transcript_19718:285-905(+)